jgi:hypothetical protein
MEIFEKVLMQLRKPLFVTLAVLALALVLSSQFGVILANPTNLAGGP